MRKVILAGIVLVSASLVPIASSIPDQYFICRIEQPQIGEEPPPPPPGCIPDEPDWDWRVFYVYDSDGEVLEVDADPPAAKWMECDGEWDLVLDQTGSTLETRTMELNWAESEALLLQQKKLEGGEYTLKRWRCDDGQQIDTPRLLGGSLYHCVMVVNVQCGFGCDVGHPVRVSIWTGGNYAGAQATCGGTAAGCYVTADLVGMCHSDQPRAGRQDFFGTCRPLGGIVVLATCHGSA